MALAIKIENLSKAYQLGEIGTGTLSRDLERWWARVRGKEDPFLRIAETNERTTKGKGDVVWSLQDINLDIEQGDAVGIIGRNGAGKSTLLKILSQVTAPTSGSVKARGRIASLLEVGTGFHPELTGRENIFLNGAILGMKKAEIKHRFDDIVEFSGVERYIDTPVKRYSSGMYVRLAFAVAAHLESEILIVDEVLAVGDAEFQRRCLGKMKQVSAGEGRTVLFVSHNMNAVASLCNTGVYLRNGLVHNVGKVAAVIDEYVSSGADLMNYRKWPESEAPGDRAARLLEAKLVSETGKLAESVSIDERIFVEYTYEILDNGFCPVPNVHLFNQRGECVFVTGATKSQASTEVGTYTARVGLPPHLFNDGRYLVGVAVSTMSPQVVHFFEQEVLVFDVTEDLNLRETDYRGPLPGVVRPKLEWHINKVSASR